MVLSKQHQTWHCTPVVPSANHVPNVNSVGRMVPELQYVCKRQTHNHTLLAFINRQCLAVSRFGLQIRCTSFFPLQQWSPHAQPRYCTWDPDERPPMSGVERHHSAESLRAEDLGSGSPSWGLLWRAIQDALLSGLAAPAAHHTPLVLSAAVVTVTLQRRGRRLRKPQEQGVSAAALRTNEISALCFWTRQTARPHLVAH